MGQSQFTTFDIVNLSKKQYELDKFIREKNQLGEPQLPLLVNAYFVEISEFLNEVRAFKNWSKKGLSRITAYEEYIDGLHFLLSIANDRWELHKDIKVGERFQRELNTYYERFKKAPQIYDETVPKSVTQFIDYSLRLYSYTQICESTLDTFISYFNLYLNAAYALGMTPEQLVTEYNRKHEINYTRQTKGNY